MPDEIAAFLADLAREGAAAKTLQSYRTDLAHFAGWFAESTGEAFAPAAVTPTDLRDHRAHLLTVEDRAPATVNRRLAALRRFFRWAKAEKLVAELPTEGVRGVNTPKQPPRSLAKREVDRLVRAAERAGGKRDLAVLELLRYTGIRVGELCALRLGDVVIGERKGSVTVRSGKGGKYRQVPLNADARRALTAYLAVRPASAEDRLFRGAGARPLGPQGVADLVAKHARRAGLDGVTPHTLRHTFARRLLDAGASLVDVAALLGHEKLETTAVYTQPHPRDLERAVERWHKVPAPTGRRRFGPSRDRFRASSRGSRAPRGHAEQYRGVRGAGVRSHRRVRMDEETGRVLSGVEAVWLDEERAAQAEARRVAFWEVLHRLAAEYGVEVVLTPKRSAARWDERYHPRRRLAATVRFARPGVVSGKRRRMSSAGKPPA